MSEDGLVINLEIGNLIRKLPGIPGRRRADLQELRCTYGDFLIEIARGWEEKFATNVTLLIYRSKTFF
jgi:hypothetical protein